MSEKTYYLFYVEQDTEFYMDFYGRWVIEKSKAELMTKANAESRLIFHQYAQVGTL